MTRQMYVESLENFTQVNKNKTFNHSAPDLASISRVGINLETLFISINCKSNITSIPVKNSCITRIEKMKCTIKQM